MSLLNIFKKKQKKTDLPDIKAGDEVKVYEKNPDGKSHIFQGIVISRKHGNEVGATITVRGEVGKVGVERIYPLHSPNIEKIEVVQSHKVRRSKLYYLRNLKGKKSRLKKTAGSPQKEEKKESEPAPKKDGSSEKKSSEKTDESK